jgi:DNA/RNA-binding domain of Phe-tRNA-synthetase-like protein
MASTEALRSFLASCKVAPEIFTLRPDYRALLLAVSGITPGSSNDFSESLLKSAEDSTRLELSQHSVNDIPHIAAWQSAYKSFGAKPKKHRNSVEALIRRVESGGLPRVNCLTDIYNAISVKHRIPIGGEDLDKYIGPAQLIVSDGTQVFETKASGEIVREVVDKGEVVWCDGEGVTCRRWNWRQGPRTALTDETQRAVFILDALESVSDAELERAGIELTEALRTLGEDVLVVRMVLGKDGAR